MFSNVQRDGGDGFFCCRSAHDRGRGV